MAHKGDDGIQERVDDIVGLFLMRFGQGVSPLHVHRSTAREIRKSLGPKIQRALESPGG
jgi:hypothetical protein